MGVQLCPVMGWHPLQSVPHFVPIDPWDWLQAPRKPLQETRYGKWIDGCCIIFIQGLHPKNNIQKTNAKFFGQLDGLGYS